MLNKSKTAKQLQIENEELRSRLAVAEQALSAFRNGEVDAIVVSGIEGNQIYSISSADTPYRIFIDEMKEGAVILKADGQILYCNQRVAEFVNIPIGNLVGSYFHSFLSEEDRSQFNLRIERTVKDRTSEILNISILNKSKTFYLQLTISPLSDSVPGDICVMIADVTELKLGELRTLEDKAQLQIEREMLQENKEQLSQLLEISKLNEDKLKVSEKLLATILNTLPVAVFGKDIKKDFQWKIWNRHAEEIFGIKAIDCIGKFDKDFFPKEQADFFRLKDIEASKSSQIIEIPEEIGNTARGQAILRTRKVVVLDANNEPSILLGITEDITESKAVLDKIKRSEDSLNKAQRLAKIGSWEFDLFTFELKWSQEHYHIFELEDQPADKLYSAYRSKIHPDDIPNLDKVVFEAIENGANFVYEHRVLCNDGRVKFVVGIGEVIRDESGKPTSVIGTCQDITERKKVEEVLRESNLMVRIVADNVPGMLGYWNRDLVCVFANKQYYTWFNRNPDQVIGMRMQDLLGDELFGKNKPYIDSALRGNYEKFERKLIKPNGEISYTWAQYIPHLLDTNVIGFFVLITDITEVKQTEQELLQAKIQAEAANKAKSQFLANMSHEIRTPLNGIVGFASLLVDTNLDLTQKEYTKNLLTSSNHLLNLINELLDFSKIQSGKMEIQITECNIREIVEEIVNAVSPQVSKKSIKLILDFSNDIPAKVKTDPLRIRQILFNLIGNAIKFTDTGSIQIKVKTFQIQDKANALLYSFQVEDTGIGIPKEKVPDLFKEFTQFNLSYERKYEGTGLGLTISKRIAKLINGDIYYRPSEKSNGSIFIFEVELEIHETGTKLNLGDDLLESETANTVQSMDVSPMNTTIENEIEINYSHEFANKKFLIVDDNEINIMLLIAIFKSFQIQCDVAIDGLDAVEKAKEVVYDIIFMDIEMPKLSGIEALAKIKELETYKNTELISIAATAHVFKESKDIFKAAGFTYYLPKPLNLKLVKEVLNKILELKKKSTY